MSEFGIQELTDEDRSYSGSTSYNGDFVIHFSHPTWRDDRNDPATATRINGVRVRR
jgi:hypothetical protein